MPNPKLDSTIYLVHHGETAWNIKKRLQGGLDSPLTTIGERTVRYPKIRRIAGRSSQPSGIITARSILGGLHHAYVRT